MRLCILNEFFYPDNTGGTSAVMSGLARSLRDNYDDVEIDVITTRHLYRSKAGLLAAADEWRGIRIFRVNTPRPERNRAIKRVLVDTVFSMQALLQLLRRRYDIILVDTAPPPLPLAARIYRTLTGTPYVYIVYDLEPDRAVVMNVLPKRHPIVRLLRWIQRDWMRGASRVVVIGRCMHDYVERMYGMNEDKLALIPNGFDPEAVYPMSKETRFRAQHGLTGFVALYSGNFGRYHDFDTLLDAAKELDRQGKRISFVLVGEGARREHLAARIASEGIKNVALHPFVHADDYADLVASADVTLVTLEPQMEGLCVPSKFYGLMAAGRPVIGMVSPTSEIARVIDESGCGVHVAQGNVDSLVAVITGLYDDPAAAARMGALGRQTLVRDYASGHVADRYYRLFKATLGEDVPVERGVDVESRATAPR